MTVMAGEAADCQPLKGQEDLDDAAWEGGSSSAQSSDFEAELLSGCEVDQVDTMASLPLDPMAAPRAKASAGAVDEPCVNPPSLGSVGHPKLCQSLCRHVASGGRCPHGGACTMCHNPRCARRSCLCKKSRAVFGGVDDCSKIGMVWPVLQAKVGELGLGSRAAQALEEWRYDVVGLPQFAGRPMGVRLLSPSLLKELNGMMLSDLCTRPILPDGVVERTKRLLIELRAMAPVPDRLATIAPTPIDQSHGE